MVGVVVTAVVLVPVVLKAQVVDTTAPVIGNMAPRILEKIWGNVVMSVDATDDVGVDRVEFFVGNSGVVHAVDYDAPYTASFNADAYPVGTLQIRAYAYDAAGNSALTKSAPVVVRANQAFTDSFEVSEWNGLWSEEAFQNKWSRTTAQAADGSYSAEVTGPSVNRTLTSKSIAMAGKTNAKISFAWRIDQALEYGEFVSLDVSTNNGTTWTPNRLILRGDLEAEDVWSATSTVLTNVSGSTNIKIRFRGTMNGVDEFAQVDSVKVETY